MNKTAYNFGAMMAKLAAPALPGAPMGAQPAAPPSAPGMATPAPTTSPALQGMTGQQARMATIQAGNAAKYGHPGGAPGKALAEAQQRIATRNTGRNQALQAQQTQRDMRMGAQQDRQQGALQANIQQHYGPQMAQAQQSMGQQTATPDRPAPPARQPLPSGPGSPNQLRYDHATRQMMPVGEYNLAHGLNKTPYPDVGATVGIGAKPAGSMGKQSLWRCWEKRASGMMFEKLLDKQQPGGKTESSLKLPGTTGSKGCCGSKGPTDAEPDFDRQAAITQKIRANAKKRKPRPAAADVALS